MSVVPEELGVGEVLDAGQDILLGDRPILVHVDEGSISLELTETTLLLNLLLQELCKHIDRHTKYLWSALALLRCDLHQPSKELACADVVLLEEEGQPTHYRFERIMIFV